MTIIESVRNYFSECPLMSDIEKINVEFLPQEIGVFSIEEVPENNVSKRYINGDEERQFTFILASRFMYSDEARMCIDNSGFLEALEDWIDEQNMNDNLPALDGGKTPTYLQILTSGYLFGIASGMRDARYQIQLRLFYDIERI